MGQDSIFRKPRVRAFRRAVGGFWILAFTVVLMAAGAGPAFATCNPCTQCPPQDCPMAQQYIKSQHASYETKIKTYIELAFIDHRDWLANEFFLDQFLPRLMQMTEQMSAVAMDQVLAIGMFFDAKQQLETQRLLQELQAQAHKDYQPSEDFCWFGTNVRSMASSEQKGLFNMQAMNARQMARELGNVSVTGSISTDQDRKSRWDKFVKVYCDPKDNNWMSTVPDSGLVLACGTGGGDTKRINIDVDYTRLIEEPRSLDVSFLDGIAPTNDTEDVVAMADNLYGHDPLRHDINPQYLKNQEYQHLYLALRSVAAKRSVAENSYNAIVGLKTAGTSDPPSGGAGPPPPKTREFLAAVLTELGVPGSEAFQILGENPSYYAQLEVLAKKIYQNPDFYANLYDTPANIERKSVALKAIDLMLDRAIYESQVRQEMAMSVLLSSRLRNTFRDVNKDLAGEGAQ